MANKNRLDNPEIALREAQARQTDAQRYEQQKIAQQGAKDQRAYSAQKIDILAISDSQLSKYDKYGKLNPNYKDQDEAQRQADLLDQQRAQQKADQRAAQNSNVIRPDDLAAGNSAAKQYLQNAAPARPGAELINETAYKPANPEYAQNEGVKNNFKVMQEIDNGSKFESNPTIKVLNPNGSGSTNKWTAEEINRFRTQTSFQQGEAAFDENGLARVVLAPYSLDEKGKRRNDIGQEVDIYGRPLASEENYAIAKKNSTEAIKSDTSQKKDNQLKTVEPITIDQPLRELFASNPAEGLSQMAEMVSEKLGITSDNPAVQDAISQITEQIKKGIFITTDPEEAIRVMENIIIGQGAGATTSSSANRDPAFVLDPNLPLKTPPSELEAAEIAKNTAAKNSMLKVETASDGSGTYQSGNNIIPFTNAGDIDWANIKDFSNISSEDLLKFAYLTNNKISQDDFNDIQRRLDQQKADAAGYKALMATQIKSWEDLAVRMQDSEYQRLQDSIHYQNNILDMEKSQSEAEMNRARNNSLEYQKRRLSASGANDALSGIARMDFEENKWAIDIANVSQRYTLEMNNLNMKLLEGRENYVLNVEQIHLTSLDKQIANEKTYMDEKNRLENESILNSKEKRNAESKNLLDFIGGMKDLESQRIAAIKAEEKEMFERNFKIMQEDTKNLGIVHEIDAAGKVTITTDPAGNPVMTTEMLKLQFDIVKEQNAQDKIWSDALGYMYKNGEIVVIDGKMIPTLNRENISFDNQLARDTFGLNQSNINFDNQMAEKQLALTREKLDYTKLKDAQNNYDLVVNEDGEYVYMLKPGQLGLGNGYVTGPNGSEKWSAGLDVDGEIGDPLISPVGGTVVFAGKNGGFGNQVRMQTHDGKYEIWYSHLNDIFAAADTSMEAGIIGTIGNSGTVIPGAGNDGSHIDFTVKDLTTGKLLTAPQAQAWIMENSTGAPIKTGFYEDGNIRTGVKKQQPAEKDEALRTVMAVKVDKKLGKPLTDEEEAMLEIDNEKANDQKELLKNFLGIQ